ncbi:MAG: cyclic nucleotide-binding domain-containing protein [Spirochaetaceae bacterium]|nr:cyclic nucleotide-binding domain-containing protein [Spirochaetaceae bacterium]
MKIDKTTYSRNVQSLGNHEIIFREGEDGRHMYVILEGTVEIRKRTGEKTTRTMITLKKGDIFGEMAVVEGKGRSATAIAASDCRLLRLDVEAFYDLVKKNPDFAVKMIKTLSSRLRSADTLIEEVMGSDTDKQVFLGIAEYLKSCGELPQGDLVAFSGPELCSWASRHLGIPEEHTKAALERLVEKRFIHQKVDASSGDLLTISKRVLLRII